MRSSGDTANKFSSRTRSFCFTQSAFFVSRRIRRITQKALACARAYRPLLVPLFVTPSVPFALLTTLPIVTSAAQSTVL